MADAIGAQTFLRLEGQPQGESFIVQDISRPGVSGRAFRRLGQQGNRGQLRGIAVAGSAAAAQAAEASYHAMVGTIVNVVKNGQTYNTYLIEAMHVDNVVGVGPGTQYLIFSTWLIVYAGT